MIKLRPAYYLACTLVALSSCSVEEMANKGIAGHGNQITFRSRLNDTRAQELTSSNFTQFHVTAFNPSDNSLVSADGTLSPYFSNELFEQIPGTSDFANFTHPEINWPEGDQALTFIAFSHSPEQMRDSCLIASEDYFELQNNSKVTDGSATLDYKMGNFRVPDDISRQYDFVTAQAVARKSDNAVVLDFKHQLSQIVVKVCGHNPSFGIEIAGVCVGQPVVEANLDFNTANGSAAWQFPQQTTKGRVSYIYSSGDVVKSLPVNQAVAEADAFSIMGNGGPAMVLPTRNGRWLGASDPYLQNEDQTMFLSVLMNVIDIDGVPLFPYLDEDQGDNVVVHLAVDNAGKVISTPLYYDSATESYYSDTAFTIKYIPSEGVSIRHYGWAAVPVDASWVPGKRYVYTLDYTSGVGIQDPVNPEPGNPIIVENSINWGVTVDDWETPDDDFDPDPDINLDSD